MGEGVATEYRITENSGVYRIEEKCITFWRRREVWRPMGTTNGPVGYFAIRAYNTLPEAEAALAKLRQYDAMQNGEWKPLDPQLQRQS